MGQHFYVVCCFFSCDLQKLTWGHDEVWDPGSSASTGWVRGVEVKMFALAKEFLAAFCCWKEHSCFSMRKQVGGLQLAALDRLLLPSCGGTKPRVTWTEKDE